MDLQTQLNKEAVRRFNQEVIAEGNINSFNELMDDQFINHSAPLGTDNGPQGMINTFNNILRPALADMQVIIHDQIAEGDLVTTRKTITGTHTGSLMGISPTDRSVSIEVIDVVRLRDGKYIEHWGINTLPVVLQQLAKN
ncbi:ester cyclase [Spirosoma oryzicola]|uniref:ester cyclase n=1 Tax=Spirosoma oryzicola TaxID=2898794 RepID=UPI001E32D931|nr:ester cyclase [Spirosoma oryzicola]UHG94657.1 ester cyclase [Spirosoma oryzicola]